MAKRKNRISLSMTPGRRSPIRRGSSHNLHHPGSETGAELASWPQGPILIIGGLLPTSAATKKIKNVPARSRPRRRKPAGGGARLNPETSDWIVWQLIDSAFPTGGFAHSMGLEAAWQHGEVRNRADLVSFIEASLQQQGSAALPLVLAAFDEPARLAEFDKLCEAFTSNHVANRASRAQGRALVAAVARIFLERGGHAAASSDDPSERKWRADQAPFAHFAPIFGFCLLQLGLPRQTTARMFLYNQLRSVLAAAVRLNIVGPMEAQMLQHRATSKAETILHLSKSLTLEDLAQTSPLLDLWQGTQDRLYSRLFQS